MRGEDGVVGAALLMVREDVKKGDGDLCKIICLR